MKFKSDFKLGMQKRLQFISNESKILHDTNFLKNIIKISNCCRCATKEGKLHFLATRVGFENENIFLHIFNNIVSLNFTERPSKSRNRTVVNSIISWSVINIS